VAYDDVKVHAVINEIDGKTSDGSKAAPVPAILGMNFQQVTDPLGFVNAADPNVPALIFPPRWRRTRRVAAIVGAMRPVGWSAGGALPDRFGGFPAGTSNVARASAPMSACYGVAVRILVVEDSERVAHAVSEALSARGYSVVVAGGVHAADEAFATDRFDVAIVDLGLPDGSGLTFCRSARRSGYDVPMLILTARNGVADRVAGLDAGADDYLGKPFSIEELAARVRALARRGPRWTDSVRTFGAVVVDRDRRVLTMHGQRVPVTAREFDIIAFIAWRDGRVVPRDELLESLWGNASERSAASLEVLLVRIRRKLAERGLREALRTVRQIGYAWALEHSHPD
jgi:DNA-binding response OmpR family regulator